MRISDWSSDVCSSDLSKRMVETILRDYARAYGLHSVSLRYFNAAGASSCGDIGEAHHIETHLVPLILEVAAGQRAALSIYGADYPTRDGTCLRDYVHEIGRVSCRDSVGQCVYISVVAESLTKKN